MIKFDRLEQLGKDHKENRNALIFVSIALVVFVAMLIESIIFSYIALIVVGGIGVGFLANALIGTIISFKESRKAYLEEETKVLTEIYRETIEMLTDAVVELDKEISNGIAKRKAEKEKAEAEKLKAKKKAEPKAKATTKRTTSKVETSSSARSRYSKK